MVAPEIGEWLCDDAKSRQPFDEIKHRQTRNEVADVANGTYNWKIERGQGGTVYNLLVYCPLKRIKSHRL